MSRDQESLRRAADLIEKHGWIQGDYGDMSQGYCAIGALSRAALATASDGTYDGSLHLLEAAIPTTFPDNPNTWSGKFSRVVEWNDTPGRTREEVLQLFRKAAGDEQAIEAPEG
ncbi:hypothetical protein SEA_JFLIX2_89 [Rhodococcus phage Jflix2]|nr:hypothetical protein SEA_JFLIX2_89 [Rhodococcus phage Jflix2]